MYRRRTYYRRRRSHRHGISRFLAVTFSSYIYHLFFKTKW